MTPEQFVYWLQGYFEVSGADYLNESATVCVRKHLDLVLMHTDAEHTKDPQKQKALTKQHGETKYRC
jgi:hypothetical protein